MKMDNSLAEAARGASAVAERAAQDASAPAEPTGAPPLAGADRGAPNWMRYAAFLFAAARAACLLSVALLTVFLDAMVAIDGEVMAAWLILGLALAPLLGAAGLSVLEARLLRGMRAAGRHHGTMAQAVVAIATLVALAVVHPLMALPVLAVGLASWGALWGAHRWGTREAGWMPSAAERTALYAGRDMRGLALARRPAGHPAAAETVRLVAPWAALVGTSPPPRSWRRRACSPPTPSRPRPSWPAGAWRRPSPAGSRAFGAIGARPSWSPSSRAGGCRRAPRGPA
ncbi:MAG: hypothetical protein ACU0CO_07785 [Shimia sp.]